MDEILLISTAETNRLLGMSFWRNPEDAELYKAGAYPKVEEILRPVLETTPKVLTYDVDTFTTHKIVLAKQPKEKRRPDPWASPPRLALLVSETPKTVLARLSLSPPQNPRPALRKICTCLISMTWSGSRTDIGRLRPQIRLSHLPIVFRAALR